MTCSCHGGVPKTLYAQDGGVHFAYQVLGDNGPDLLLVPSPNFPIDLVWDDALSPDTFTAWGRSVV